MPLLIEDYEQQYSALIAKITAQISHLNIAPKSTRNELIQGITANCEEARELLEQISLEIREAPPDQRSGLTSRVNCYEVELKRLQQEFIKSKNSTLGAANLESDEDFSDIGIQDESKRRLLDNSERLERTGKHLDEGYRIVLETENLGNSILQDLSSQRETIQRSRSRVQQMDVELGKSSRILNFMMLRSLKEKIILAGVGAVFIVAISFSIYYSVK
ncbi:vesicle transport through interaction with t-SNAREs homolog 1A [Phlebotomus argentipes]|uniref:vesicle transport through interaction with t-SNAREs homolog 1A n=1 Tax=Phlebotomus argentipes TaxID=94469 RepID=UPI002892A293|nr:vesicle transport through interaction with t-SNAREs homolog 1A [Phlebotomus argentipes]